MKEALFNGGRDECTIWVEASDLQHCIMKVEAFVLATGRNVVVRSLDEFRKLCLGTVINAYE